MSEELVKTDQEDDEKTVPRIVYIGNDLTFFNNLKEKYAELSPTVELEFQSAAAVDAIKIQSFIIRIRLNKPKLVILDFSTHEKAMLHLARIWLRQNTLNPTNMMGVCDYKQGRALVVQGIMTSLPCIHIKSSEYEAIVHSINMLAFPLLIEDHGFATAELSDPINAYYPAKASLINENFIRLESNLPLMDKQQVNVHSYWFRAKILGSTLAMCVNQSKENLYYNYKFSQALQFAHANPVEQTDDMTEVDFQKLQEKRKEGIVRSKKLINNWIGQNKKFSKPKYLKAYIIDKKGVFFDDKPQSDSYIYVFRNQPFVANAKEELLATKPQIIIWNLEKVSKADRDAGADIAVTFNDMPNLNKFVAGIKEAFQGFQPVLIVFNAEEQDTAALKSALNYQSLIAVKEPMDVNLALKMCEMLRPKIEPSLPKPKESDLYIDKNSEISYCEIESDITLLSCSENDVHFNSDTDIPLGTVLRVSLPVPMYITVCAKPEFSKIEAKYYGFIHGIGEIERQQLRRYINDIFFRDHQQKKEEDKAERELQKQKYLESKTKVENPDSNEEDEAEKALEQKAKDLVDQIEK